MLNKVIFQGFIMTNISNLAIIKTARSGIKYMKFAIAIPKYTAVGQIYKEPTKVSCIAYDKVALKLNQMAEKSMNIIVEGYIQDSIFFENSTKKIEATLICVTDFTLMAKKKNNQESSVDVIEKIEDMHEPINTDKIVFISEEDSKDINDIDED